MAFAPSSDARAESKGTRHFGPRDDKEEEKEKEGVEHCKLAPSEPRVRHNGEGLRGGPSSARSTEHCVFLARPPPGRQANAEAIAEGSYLI